MYESFIFTLALYGFLGAMVFAAGSFKFIISSIRNRDRSIIMTSVRVIMGVAVILCSISLAYWSSLQFSPEHSSNNLIGSDSVMKILLIVFLAALAIICLGIAGVIVDQLITVFNCTSGVGRPKVDKNIVVSVLCAIFLVLLSFGIVFCTVHFNYNLSIVTH